MLPFSVFVGAGKKLEEGAGSRSRGRLSLSIGEKSGKKSRKKNICNYLWGKAFCNGDK